MKAAASRRDVMAMKRMAEDGMDIKKISKRLNIKEEVVNAFLKGKKPPKDKPSDKPAGNAKPAPSKKKAVPKPKVAEEAAESEPETVGEG